jgi:predicted nuclease with TOPRIM domain
MNQTSEQVLLSTMLQEIREKAAKLIEERNRLNEEKRTLVDQVAALQTRIAEQEAQLAQLETASEPQPSMVASSDPIVGERIRALVDEIDACIALMPHARDVATVELLSA